MKKIIMIEGAGKKTFEMVSYERKRRGLPTTTIDDFVRSGLNIHLIRQLRERAESVGYIIESWKTVKGNSVFERYVEGVKHRTFRSYSFGAFDLSPSLLNALRQEISYHEIVLHSNLYHTSLLWSILFFYGGIIPIVYSHHGGQNPKLKMRRTEGRVNILINSILMIEYLIERATFRNIDVFRPITIFERKYLEDITKRTGIKVSIGYGIDTDIFQPIRKDDARRRLGLPQKAPILIYVGHAYKLKGADVLIRTFDHLKKSHPDLKMIFIGVSDNDELTAQARSAGIRVYGWKDRMRDMPLFYSASDYYVMPAFPPNQDYGSKFIFTGGPGIAMLEALSCGLPVISTTLMHFPDDEWRQCGLIPEDPEDFRNIVTMCLRSSQQFKECRNVVMRLYSLESFSDDVIGSYEMLFEKYYPG